MVNLEGCEGVLKVFCHLGLCHAFIPLKDASNDVYPLSVIRSSAAGSLKVGFEKNSRPAKVLKNRLLQKTELE